MLSDEEYQKRIQELVDKKFKSLYFIHIPKAAGSYVRHFPIDEIKTDPAHEQFHSHPPWEGDQYGSQVPWRELIANGDTACGYRKVDTSKIPPSSLKFATIRNPFDYLISCYFSSMVGTNYTKNLPPEPFLIRYSQGKDLYLQSRKNLFHQIFDDDGRCCVDVLIRTESIDIGLNLLNKLIFKRDDKKITAGPKNVTKEREKKGYQQFYSKEVRKMVEKKAEKEMRIFGYTFDGPVDKRPFVFLDRDKKYDIF
jgi:hypothetical protein